MQAYALILHYRFQVQRYRTDWRKRFCRGLVCFRPHVFQRMQLHVLDLHSGLQASFLEMDFTVCMFEMVNGLQIYNWWGCWKMNYRFGDWALQTGLQINEFKQDFWFLKVKQVDDFEKEWFYRLEHRFVFRFFLKVFSTDFIWVQAFKFS